MSLFKNWPNLTFKDKVDIIGDIFTIIVSMIALGGTIIAWQNGFWHDIRHLAKHYHQEIVAEEQKLE